MLIDARVLGNPNGKNIYSVVILDDDDLANCDGRLYAADSADEVGNILNEEGYSDNNFILKEIGKRV